MQPASGDPIVGGGPKSRCFFLDFFWAVFSFPPNPTGFSLVDLAAFFI
jgi:hypothetical protein